MSDTFLKIVEALAELPPLHLVAIAGVFVSAAALVHGGKLVALLKPARAPKKQSRRRS